MIADSPPMNEPRQQESVPGSPLAHPALVGTLVDENRDNDVLNVAYHELRRSVSPEVADYVFKPKGERGFSGRNRSVGTDWTPERILNLSLGEVELQKLTRRNLDDLANIGTNLWNFGASQYFPCCARVFEIALAWYNTLNPKDGNQRLHAMMNLSTVYMSMSRLTECEAILTKVIAENDVVCDGGITANRSRSLLGILRSMQGQYTSAERLSVEAMDSLRSLPGLAHLYTWFAHNATFRVLEAQGKFDARQRLSNRFYNDIHQTLSPQLLPSLRLLLEFCERCIEDWMSESKLQRLVRKSYLCDGQLGVRERHSLTLQIMLCERWIRDATIGAVPEAAMDLKKSTSMEAEHILGTFARLVGLKIGSLRQLGSRNLRREALKAVQDLKLAKFLVPIWIFAVLNEPSLALETFDWKQAEQDLIHPLRVAEANHNTGAPQCSISTGSEYPGSASTMENWCADRQFETQVFQTFASVQAHNGFSQTLYLAEGCQPPENAPPHHRFSPTIMNTATSAFTFSSPQSSRLSRMSPPRQPDQESPAVAPSSVLAGLRGSSISPDPFGIHLSPLQPSFSLASLPPPRF
jgi:hypothetical protein